MAKNIDLSDIDFSDVNQEPTQPQSTGLDLSGINFGDEPEPTAAPEKEDSWGDVIYKSLSAMPERMQRSWAGLKQAVAPAFNNTDVDAQAESLISAAQQGVESAQAKMAELGFNPNDMGFIDKGKLRQALAFDNVKDDEDFKAARDEGLRLTAEIAKTAPKTGDQWSAKNLVSTVLTGAQDMAPSVLLGLITKSPGIGLAEMSGQAYGSYYQDGIDKGMKPAEANNRASLFAALEPITEAMPLALILKPAGKGLTDLGKSAVAEGLQESFTQAAQDAYDIGVLDENMTVGQFLNNMAFSGVAGAGTGGVLHGAVNAPGMIREAADNRAVRKAARGAEGESGQAVPTIDPAEYDAVSAEMGGDALDKLTEQAVPEISAARRQAYADARASGLSPADALTQARGQDAGADLLDQMVADVFDSPDSIYYANKSSAANPPQSVAEMVQQQVAGGDVGPVAGETLGLPSPGQASTIALGGPIAPISEPTGYQPTGMRDELRAPGPKLDLSDIDFGSPVDAVLPQTTAELPPIPTKKAELPPVPPVAEVKAELPPIPPAAEPSKAATLFGRKKKAAPVEEVDAELLAEQEAERAAEKARGDALVADYIARNENLPPVPGKDGKPKLKPLQVTMQLVKDAKDRGVEAGAKVNWNGKEYDVDKLQGRAVRLIDENGNGHIADIREVNAPATQEASAPKQTLDTSDIDFSSDNMIEPGSDVDTRADAWNKTIDAMSISEANDLADDVGIKRRPNVDVKAQLKNVHPDDLDNSASPKQAMDAENNMQQGILPEDVGAFEKSPEVQRGVDAQRAKAAQLIKDGAQIVRDEKGNRFVEMPDGTRTPSREMGLYVMQELRRAKRDKVMEDVDNMRKGAAEKPSSVPEEGQRLGFEPVPADHELSGKFAKDNSGTPRKIVAVKGRQYMLENGDKFVQRFGDDPRISGSRRPVLELQTAKNTMQDLIKQAENTKRPLSKMRADMAAMLDQTDRDDLFTPVEGRTRKQIADELRRRAEGLEESYDFSDDIGKFTRGNMEVVSRQEKDGEPTVTLRYPNRGMTLTVPEASLERAIKKGVATRRGAKPEGAASLKTEKPAKGMKDTDVAAVAVDFINQYKGVEAVDMSVMQKQDDLGIDIPEGKSLLGFYEPGKISAKLVAENIGSREEAEALLRHELIVHYGLRARLSKAEYDAEMDKVLAAENSRTLAPFFKEAREKYDDFYDTSSPDGQRMIAEEVVARVAEDASALEKSSVMRRVLEALRQLMIKAKLLPNSASMESVKKLIQANASYLKNTTVDRNDVRVSLPPMAYNAPQDMTAAMNKDTDIDKADVPDDIKDGMRNTMYRDTRSMYQRIKDMMADNFNLSGIYQGIFDDLHAIKRYEELSNNGKLKMGRESAYKFSMLAKNINSIVAVAMNKGAPVYDNGAVGVSKTTKGFTEIFKPVMEMKGNMLPVWEYWAGAVRAKRLLAEGREQLYTEKQINDIIDYVNRRPELRKAFNQAHKDWRDLNKEVLDFGEATGIIDPEARKLFESDDYVPFYRVDEEADRATAPSGKRGLANQSSGIRKLKGGEGKLDILENMARNVNHIISSGFKNAAMQRVKDVAINAAMEEVPTNFKPVGISNEQMKRALNDMGIATSGMSAQQMKGYTNLFTAAAPAGPNIISVRYNGKPQYFEVTDPQLMRAIAGIGPERLHAILKVLAIPKKILTRAVTSTPTFIATNLTRDIAGNFAQLAKETGRNTAPKIITDILTLRPVYKAMQGALRSITKHDMVTDYQVSGGMSGGYDQSRPESVAKHLRQLGKRNVIIDTPKKLWDLYETVLTASEQATRMAVYQDVLNNTKDPVEAAYQANDVMNFSRRGDNVLTHVLISTVPFLNARLQGLDRLARGAIDSPKAFLLKGAIMTAATMSLMAMNADDEDYWALPEYERDMFWVIPVNGTRFRIPKPFEVGAVFGTIPERIFEATFRDDHMFKDRMGFMLSQTFALDLPQFIKPIYEDQANMNSFTQRPIVPQALQRVQPNQQASTSTPEWIKGFSKSLPEAAPEWMRSPLRLQHMIEAYTGSMGQYVVSTTDAMYNELFTQKVMPAKREYDMPIIRSFVRAGESNDKYVDRLYQMSEKAGQTYGTLKAYKDQKNVEEYRKFAKGNESVLAARRRIDKAVAQMQKLNKQTKAIYASETMTPEEKREQLDALTVKKNDLAKEMSDKYWNLF